MQKRDFELKSKYQTKKDTYSGERTGKKLQNSIQQNSLEQVKQLIRKEREENYKRSE